MLSWICTKVNVDRRLLGVVKHIKTGYDTVSLQLVDIAVYARHLRDSRPSRSADSINPQPAYESFLSPFISTSSLACARLCGSAIIIKSSHF